MVRAIVPARINKDDGAFKSITIPSASVLTLNSVGYQLMTAPVNTAKVICLIEIFCRITAGTAYASLHDMTIGYGTATSNGVAITTIPGTAFLDQTVSTGVWASFDGTSSKGTIVTQSSGGIYIQMGTSDPTTGTSPLVVKIKYKIHGLP